MRVAILCPGLGHANRGYERFAEDLYATLRERLDITLFRGAGAREDGQISANWPGRDHPAIRLLGRSRRDVYFWEALLFAARLWPAVARGGFDVLHYSEPPLNGILTRFDKLFPSKAKRVFSHGVGMAPQHYLRCHFVHQVSRTEYARGLAAGLSPDRTRHLPYGIRAERFTRPSDDRRTELRLKQSVPREAFVVLAVSAINDSHKRIRHLTRVVAALGPPFHLVLCGKPEEPAVLEEAREALSGRCTHLYVGPDCMSDVYGLADVFILASLEEGFGLAILEAGLMGLPIVLAEQANLRWLTSEESSLHIDMTNEELTRSTLRKVRENIDRHQTAATAARAQLIARYSWEGLAPDYVAMYRDVVRGPATLIADAQLAR